MSSCFLKMTYWFNCLVNRKTAGKAFNTNDLEKPYKMVGTKPEIISRFSLFNNDSIETPTFSPFSLNSSKESSFTLSGFDKIYSNVFNSNKTIEKENMLLLLPIYEEYENSDEDFSISMEDNTDNVIALNDFLFFSDYIVSLPNFSDLNGVLNFIVVNQIELLVMF
jgi:hypothetical protein